MLLLGVCKSLKMWISSLWAWIASLIYLFIYPLKPAREPGSAEVASPMQVGEDWTLKGLG